MNRIPDRPTEHASAEDIEAIARSRIERARIDILLEQPFLASALLSMPLRGTSETAIRKAVVTDGRRIVYRYDRVAELGRPQVRRLIMHALLHCVLRHPERGGSRNWTLWTAACDIAIDILFRDLGLGSDHDESFLGNFDRGSAESIYERLVPGEDRPTIRCREASDAILRPSARTELPGCGDGGDDAEDDEDDEGEVAERSAFERTMSDADVPTSIQLEGVKRSVRDAVRSRSRASYGSHRGSGSAEIDAAAEEQVCWRSMLARFMREPIAREWSCARPNRRHIWRGLYLPGPVPIEGGRFVVAIDTSGSMSDRELGAILGEVDAIRRTCVCDLTVLQFDADLHAVAEYPHGADEDERIGSTRIMRFLGRGGTDLRIPFTWAAEEREQGRRISALIVCTDGEGPLPAAAPCDLPVLFLLTPQHSAPAFGQRVVLGPSRHAARDPETDGDVGEHVHREVDF